MSIWQRHTDPAHIEEIYEELPAHLAHLHGTKIVQVSDLHIGRYHRAEQWADNIAVINSLSPDLVVITGDAMDWPRRYEPDYVEPFRLLNPRVAVLAILGNHDFYFGPNRLTRVYKQDTHAVLLRGDRWESDALKGLVVWGIDDPMTPLSAPSDYPKLQEWAARGMDPAKYHVLLSHRPDAFPLAAKLGFDLQLSGHTHGGQLSFELPSGRRVHIASVLGPYDRGRFSRDKAVAAAAPKSHLYVNRGLGYTGVPYRRDCPSEVTLVRLVAPRQVLEQAA
jgi:hypothetical protein